MVGGLALALRELGVQVSGTDVAEFPPMPENLRRAGVRVHQGWSAEHLPARVDAVVTGALLSRSGQGNPELEAAMNRRIPVWNATAFLEHYFLRRSENFVVAGTKGKTSTTAMLAWILECAGLSPDWMVGGQIRGDSLRARLRRAPLMVLEGDECRCGLGDPLPKFLRYHPAHLLVTNVSHDHHEMFPNPDHYMNSFVNLVNQVPGNGSLTLNADDAGAMKLMERTPTPAGTVGFSRKATHRITAFRTAENGCAFKVVGVPFQLSLHGRMNALNAALAAVAAGHAGVSLRAAARALLRFPGVEGRLEKIGTAGRSPIYVDEAYHPIAFRALLDAVQELHPRRRVVVLFEPRNTGGRREICQKELPDSLAKADVVLVSPSIEVAYFHPPFDHKSLCRDLCKRGVQAIPLARIDDVTDEILSHWRDGDVVVISFSLIRGELTNTLARLLQQAASARNKKSDTE
jgi:UDP-N-acetylmuramate: L-alanyl-gamma-D-glutamyl-meso-diaminopimelate ligase